MKVNRSTLQLFISLILLFSGGRILGQGISSIDGTIEDTTQAAIAGSSLTLTNIDTGGKRVATSTSDGYFVFHDLAPGNYRLQVTAPGFQTWSQTGITLAVGQSLTLSPRLQVGSQTTQVEVTGAAPQVTTSSSNISDVVDTKRIEQLPLNGRNALQLVALAPGVVSTGNFQPSGQFGATQVTYASSGGRDIDANYTLDGGYNEDTFYAIPNYYPSPDALQEFAVSSRNYSAQFGRGSTDVSAVTRSGTNSLHGSVFEFLRNTNLDSKPYFSPTLPSFHRNQFGGTVGGPIKRDKLFFFLGYQGTEQSGGPGNQTYTTIPMAERTGDFSGVATPVINPATGNPFPGNVIPQAQITPQATAFFNQYLPAPNLGDSTYSFPDIGTLSEHQGVAKVDFQATRSDLFFVRYFIDDIPQTAFASGSGSALAANWLSSLPTRFQNTTVGYVHTFSPNLLNDFHFTYNRSSFGVLPLINFSLAGLGYGVNTQNAFTQYGLTPDSSLSVNGSFGAYPGAPTRDIMPTTHISDNVSWTKGIHSLNFGFELYRNRINETQNFYTGGSLQFSGQASGVPAADFLLGEFSSYQQLGGLASRLRQTLPSVYVQDDIKLTPRLTLNAGIRWDIVSGYHSENGQLLTYEPGQQSTVFPLATPGLLYAGDSGVPDDVIGTRWNNIAPRIGIAWNVRGDGRTSVRAGFGTFFVPLTRGITLNRLTEIQPFTIEVNLNGGDAQNIFAQAPYNGVNPFPRPTATSYEGLKQLPFQPTAGESSIERDFKTEADYEWSLSLQQQLWKNAVLEADYVGSSSSHLVTSLESNAAHYIPGSSTVSNTQARRGDPEIGSINTIAGALSSNYNGLQVVFSQQLIHGVTLKSAYTWAKTLGVTGCETEGCSGPRDPYDYSLDYGPLSFDVNQNWVTSFLWQPYEGKTLRSAALRNTLGNWQLGGILTVQSGMPLGLLSGLDNSFTGINGDTPDIVGTWGSWNISGNRSKADEIQQWFNPAAFKANAVGTFGQLSQGALRDPGMINFDLNIQKNFQFTERYRFEFRSSLYNAFNHTNLGPPVNTLTSSNFGAIQSALNPRVIEFGARLVF